MTWKATCVVLSVVAGATVLAQQGVMDSPGVYAIYSTVLGGVIVSHIRNGNGR